MIRIEPTLLELGYQIIAISGDRPEALQQSQQKHKPNYLLLSDSSLQGAKELGIAWKADSAMLKKLQGFGIDLELASGEKHHMLPVPAAYVIGTDGVIKFAYINPNHKVRVPSAVLLAAAKEALK